MKKKFWKCGIVILFVLSACAHTGLNEEYPAAAEDYFGGTTKALEYDHARDQEKEKKQEKDPHFEDFRKREGY